MGLTNAALNIAQLAHMISTSSTAQDAANLYASGDPQVADPPGAPIGSGLRAYWSQNSSDPMPSGLENNIRSKQAQAANGVAQDVMTGGLDPKSGLLKISQMTGQDPTSLIGRAMYSQALGVAGQTQAPALASYGSSGDSNPNAPAPSNVSGSMPYPNLAAATGVLNGQPVQQQDNRNPQQRLMDATIWSGGDPLAASQKIATINKDNADAASAQAAAKEKYWTMGVSPQDGQGSPQTASQPVLSGSPIQQANQAYARLQHVENAAGDPTAVGDGGLALGIGQTHPAAFAEGAAYAGLQNPDPKNPAHQAIASRGYFDKQLDRFGGDIPKAVVAYNKPEVAANWDGNPATLPAQQADYLNKVLGQPQQQTPQLGGKAAQEVAQKQAEEKNAETMAAEKGVAQTLSRLSSMKQKLQDMRTLAPNTISGMGVVPSQDSNESFGLKGQLMTQFPKVLDKNDQIGASSTFKNLNDQLFVNEIPALMNGASGMRMDIPLVKGVKSASGVPMELPPQDKLQVIDTLDKNFDQTRDNALSYYKNLTGKDYDLGKAFQTPQDVIQGIKSGVITKAQGAQILQQHHGFQ